MGGTFDPVHNGHLKSAQQLAQTLGYSAVHLMPCGDAYHKQGVSQAIHRVAMLKLAVADEPLLTVDERETKRQGATYTVDTLAQLREELGQDTHISWILGTDAALGLSDWHNWQQVFKLANIILIHRAGEHLPKGVTDKWAANEYLDPLSFKQQSHGGFIQLGLEPFQESSTAIRQALETEQSVDHHVPQAVLNYIEQHGLYRGNH
ncbi:nicotinate-nucleotide adenylyltransferase [Oceaniserpentilla sp. 4NH20-0058]